MRIALLGAAGQLGRALAPRLSGEVIPLSRTHINLSHPETIASAFTSLRPDVFVNCAAYNLVNQAETDPQAAFSVNAWGVRELARVCAANGVKLVHFSSDYVFGLDTTRTLPLTEDDLPGPVNVYGLSKLAGEYCARTFAPDSLVIRTCGLYGVAGAGGKGTNFVETMLRLAGEGKPLSVVNDQRCTPSYAVDVAEKSAALIRANATGLFHVTNAGSCTWHEFAAEIFRQADLKPRLTTITSAERHDPAIRPRFSVLANAKLASVNVVAPRNWQDALPAYFVERSNAPR
jgi:dTDP-4-dehydrorhamnose reductase